MTTLKRAIPFLGRACTECGRSFHSASIFMARARALPKTVTTSRPAGAPTPGKTVRMRRPIDPEEALPPIGLLQSGSKSGALNITPDAALDLLRQYVKLAQQSSGGWEQLLCEDYNTSPTTIYRLGQILNRCPSNAQRSLARRLVHTASLLGENSATFDIIESALSKGTLDLEEFTAPLKRLGLLAKQERNPQAMVLLGKVMLAVDQEREAYDWFRKSTQNGIDFEGAAEALVQEGRVLLARGDKAGAEAAFKKAALELDEPSGYFYLSQLQPPGSTEQRVYLLKAASSRIIEPSHSLGALEMERLKEKGDGPASIRDFDAAKEWFEVAAAEGFGLSMLNLAMIYEAGGQLAEGEKWLKKAEQLPEIKAEAKRVRSQWGKV